MGTRIQTSWDCRDCVASALWWAEALHWEFEYLDPAFFEQMKAQGFCDDTAAVRLADGRLSWADGAAIHDPDNPQARMYFQNVPEEKVVKNRLHIDVQVGAGLVESEVERLNDRGATEVGRNSQGPHSWVVMRDPEGNEFCVS
jgi:hypothetical protein